MPTAGSVHGSEACACGSHVGAGCWAGYGWGRGRAEARRYLDEQHRDYERRLAYGNFTRNEQRRIDQTFAYLYNRYPAPARDDLNARLDEV